MDKVKQIEELMEKNRLFGDVWDLLERGRHVVKVEICWGDWKHDHLRLEFLVKENMPELISHDKEIIEENGTDCYSAIHKFYF